MQTYNRQLTDMAQNTDNAVCDGSIKNVTNINRTCYYYLSQSLIDANKSKIQAYIDSASGSFVYK